MAVSVISIFVLAEYFSGNCGRRVLLRLVIEKELVIVNEDDSVEASRLDERNGPFAVTEGLTTELCECSKEWLVGSCSVLPGHCLLLRLSPYVFSCLVHEIKKSRNFRNNLIDRICVRSRSSKKVGVLLRCCRASGPSFSGFHLPVRIVLRWRGPFILDKQWIYRLESLMQERLVLDETMAGLSTLGGAFSSLGDELVAYARTAGRISLQQLQFAAKLGDQVLICKCKLFLALSLLQQGRITLPKQLIWEQYQVAKSLPENQRDTRLENMCKGAWAKLQYIHQRGKAKREYNHKAGRLAITGRH